MENLEGSTGCFDLHGEKSQFDLWHLSRPSCLSTFLACLSSFWRLTHNQSPTSLQTFTATLTPKPGFEKVVKQLFEQFVHHHMGPEHASREKKCSMVIFFIFSHKNINTNGFQKIKFRPLQDFEKYPKTCPDRPKKRPNLFALFAKRPI